MKEVHIMTRNELYFKNRIALLQGRTRENANIIRKLQRELRRIAS